MWTATQATERKRVRVTERIAYGLNEVATMLGVSESMVRLEVNRGKLRTYRIGKRVLVGAESLKAYLAERAR